MPVYLDYNATSPMDARVVEAMMPYLTGPYGNPSSVHRYGRAARAAIDQARQQVATMLGVEPSQIIFTGGGSEANNLAIKGTAACMTPGRIMVSAIEHPSILEAADSLVDSSAGWQSERIPVDADGKVCFPDEWPDDLRLVSVMAANNETGAIQNVADCAQSVHEVNAVMHCDAVQAAGKMPLDFAAMGVDLMTLSAHKFSGPKGIGALIASKTVQLAPLVHGGGQESGLRSGTENLPAIVGFGAAAEIITAELDSRVAHLEALRTQFETGLNSMPGMTLFATATNRLPNTTQFSMAGIDGEALLMELDRRSIAVSSGSACAAGKDEPSHVLLAMGVEPDLAHAAVRVSFGPENSDADVAAAMMALNEISAMVPRES